MPVLPGGTHFQCESCGGRYLLGDDDAATEELRTSFGDEPKEDCAMVCDECYAKINQWLGESKT